MLELFICNFLPTIFIKKNYFPTDRPYFGGIVRYRKHIIFFIWPYIVMPSTYIVMMSTILKSSGYKIWKFQLKLVCLCSLSVL